MSAGRIAQIGAPIELYQSPRSIFVADFLGDSNLVPITVLEVENGQARGRTASGEIISATTDTYQPKVGERATVLIRPEDVTIGARGADAASEGLSGIVSDVS